ncbi:MAG: F0F1 ATP synthase subunit epsilon [Verrucomicrobia bacterium]|nr:F0F1 ATP synthase subunit epsilon [Verrucomicrobiota bacterium]
MASTLKLEIVTPEAVAYSETVDMVVLPGAAGELGVLAGHEPLMTTVVPGELRVIRGSEETVMAIGSGFAEITGETVRVLADMALRAEEIDEAAAIEARKRAEQRLAEKLSDEEIVTVEASLQKALIQLEVKRRYRGQPTAHGQHSHQK